MFNFSVVHDAGPTPRVTTWKFKPERSCCASEGFKQKCYGTSWYSDPREQLTGILLTQRMMDSPQPPRAFVDFWTSTYQAIDD